MPHERIREHLGVLTELYTYLVRVMTLCKRDICYELAIRFLIMLIGTELREICDLLAKNFEECIEYVSSEGGNEEVSLLVSELLTVGSAERAVNAPLDYIENLAKRFTALYYKVLRKIAEYRP